MNEATEALKTLRSSPDYELWQTIGGEPAALDAVIEKHRRQLAQEISDLENETHRLAEELSKHGQSLGWGDAGGAEANSPGVRSG